MGAESAVGVDIDDVAVRTAKENAEINNVADRFTAICGSFTDKVDVYKRQYRDCRQCNRYFSLPQAVLFLCRDR